MARPIISLDIGASQLRMAEFSMIGSGGLQLESYAIRSLGQELSADADPSAYIVSTIRDIMRENGIKPGPALVSVSGKDIFPRYVNLPPVTHEKVDQIVKYEAQQNVPFPIDEVVWDYQLINKQDGTQSVMLVAIKNEVVKKLTDCVEATGLDATVVDVAPMALYNAVCFNYGGLEGCTLVIDMGARTTNLIFIETEKVFTRSLPVGGNTITQELMKEFELPFKDAEELKIAHAFVAFGGVVDTGDSRVVNRVSKTVRSVMTRLHAEISRSINFYRSQQRGSKPSTLLLTGGTSIIRETDTFLREKFGLRVEYLNPFTNVSVASRISAEELAKNMHLLSEVTGLALRRAYSCPMEINLMPAELGAKRALRSKVPFFFVAAGAALVILVCWWMYFGKVRGMKERMLQQVQTKLADLNSTQEKLDSLQALMVAETAKTDHLLGLIDLRTRWIDIIEKVHSRMRDGMWLTAVKPDIPTRGKRVIREIKVEGIGFIDKVQSAEAVGAFAADLEKMDLFQKVVVDRARRGFPQVFCLEFTINLTLAEEIELNRK